MHGLFSCHADLAADKVGTYSVYCSDVLRAVNLPRASHELLLQGCTISDAMCIADLRDPQRLEAVLEELGETVTSLEDRCDFILHLLAKMQLRH